MKKFVLCVVVLFIVVIKPKAQDIPTPTANLQTVASGSYVIPMDNTLQGLTNGNFNLSTYGLIVHLLYNDVKLNWAIRTGKAKDGIDFSGNAEQLQPTYVAGTANRNFIGGPFVINAADTTGVSALIDSFYAKNALTGSDRPKVFRLTADVANVDIRYDLTGFRPKAAILTDGGNQVIHYNYMTVCKIPSESYAYASGPELLIKCFTFASEPHNDLVGPTIDATITAIRRFVEFGGNFLAQCAAVPNYENNTLGRFQTSNGIVTLNANVSTNVTFPHPDLSFSQIHGGYHASKNGSVRNWVMTSGINDEHNHATGTGVLENAIGASVSKLRAGKGGMVFYVGNHDFNDNTTEGTNGIRMYMNAFLTPVSINTNCKTGEILGGVLPIKLISFQGNRDNNRINLQWVIGENQDADRFEVEKSLDGKSFTTAALVFASEKSGQANYTYYEDIAAGRVIYRLKMIDNSQKVGYSKLLVFQQDSKTGNNPLVLLSNPVADKLTISFSSDRNQPAEISIYDMSGRKLMSQNINASRGDNLLSLPLPPAIKNGLYISELRVGGERQTVRFVKQ